MYNDLPANIYYRKKLRSYFLTEYRFATHNVYTLSSVLDRPQVPYVCRLSVLFHFLNSYRSLFYQLLAENFFVLRRLKRSRSSVLFRLFFMFRATRLFVTMQNAKSENLFFLSLGFFLKYFEKRKVLKKSKAFKLFMARTLRKLFLLSGLSKFYFFVRGVPIHFVEMLRLINKRIDHPFFNPYENAIFDESASSTPVRVIQIPYFFFTKNTSFVPVKTRKRGRIKRKLRRRLIAKNRVAD